MQNRPYPDQPQQLAACLTKFDGSSCCTRSSSSKSLERLPLGVWVVPAAVPILMHPPIAGRPPPQGRQPFVGHKVVELVHQQGVAVIGGASQPGKPLGEKVHVKLRVGGWENGRE